MDTPTAPAPPPLQPPAQPPQEVPAFFADRRLSVLALYNGDAPWSGGNLTFVMPGGVNEVRLPSVYALKRLDYVGSRASHEVASTRWAVDTEAEGTTGLGRH